MPEDQPLSSEEMIRRARRELSATHVPTAEETEQATVELHEAGEVEEIEEPAEIEFEARPSRPRPVRARPRRDHPLAGPTVRTTPQSQRVAAAIAVAMLIMGVAVAIALLAAGNP